MGFSQKTLDFLFENRMHNSKAWFDAHKDDYNALVFAPLAELVSALAPTMLDIDGGLIVEPRVDRSISRIRRDTRFSKDKSLYRDVMWCVFIRNKKLYYGYPGFFFEISPCGCRYGCGYYTASPASMENMRKMILCGSPIFTKALDSYEAQDVFSLDGEKYKRPKYPDHPENIQNWLDRKCIDFIHSESDPSFIFSDSLAERLAKDFLLLKDEYNFMLCAEEMPK